MALPVALELGRPGDAEGSDVLPAVRAHGFTLLSTRTDHFVFLCARWDEGLAQEVMYVWRTAQAGQGHEGLEMREERHCLDSTMFPASLKLTALFKVFICF